jgi:hypothetical protein
MLTRTNPQITVTLDPYAAKAARSLAKAEGLSLSAWLSRAALREAKLVDARKVTAELIAEYEIEHGPIPPEVDEQVAAKRIRREAFLSNPKTIESYEAALTSLGGSGQENVNEPSQHSV